MNNENILAQMGQLKMGGMQEAFREQQSHPKHADLSFEDRLSLLLDRELLKKDANRVQNLQRRAKLRQAASIEVIWVRMFGTKLRKNKSYSSSHYY